MFDVWSNYTDDDVYNFLICTVIKIESNDLITNYQFPSKGICAKLMAGGSFDATRRRSPFTGDHTLHKSTHYNTNHPSLATMGLEGKNTDHPLRNCNNQTLQYESIRLCYRRVIVHIPKIKLQYKSIRLFYSTHPKDHVTIQIHKITYINPKWD